MPNQIQKRNRQTAPPAPVVQSALEQLQARLNATADKAKAIEAKADQEKRDLNADEVNQLKVLTEQFDALEEQIEARQTREQMEARLREPQDRLVDPGEGVEEPARSPLNITGGDKPGASTKTGGFQSMGEWASLARGRAMGGKLDERFVNGPREFARVFNAPSSYGGEGVSQDGGFAVPPDFRENIKKLVFGEDQLISRTDQQVTSSNSITLPLDATTPWQTSGGPLSFWLGEGNDITISKPALGQLNCKANKVAALVPLTDELLEDVPALTRWLEAKVPEKFTYAINFAIVQGTGAGQPQGLLNAPSKVTQAAVTGQGAGTVVYKNIVQMWGRMYGRLRPNAIWIINQDVEQQLQQMTVPAGSSVFPAYLPPGGLMASPFGTLMGRPIITTEACNAVGTEGDIILTDLTQYLTVVKSGGMRADVSIHLYFQSDHTAFRFIMRVGGQSYWNAPITRANGSNTLSPIVTLNSTRT